MCGVAIIQKFNKMKTNIFMDSKTLYTPLDICTGQMKSGSF